MIEKLVRNDTPQGLVFPLGYRVTPRSRSQPQFFRGVLAIGAVWSKR